MTRAGVLTLGPEGYALNPAAPLPADVLPLEADRRDREDGIRWEWLHTPLAQSILRLFRPADIAPADRITTTLAGLAAELDTTSEDLRAAIEILIGQGEFAAHPSVTTLPDYDEFVLTVDWEKFHRGRLGVQLSPPTGE